MDSLDPAVEIRRIMGEVFRLPPEAITDECTPDHIERWDSLRHVNLVTALERAFEIRLTDEEVMTMLSPPSIREAVRRARARAGRPL